MKTPYLKPHLAFFFVLVACAGPTEDADLVDTTDTVDPGDTDAPQPTDERCDNLPETPLSIQEITGAVGYKGLAFDTEGHIVGSDGNDLLRVTYDGSVSPLAINVGEVEQLIYMSNGDLLASSSWDNGLQRITPAGTYETLMQDLSAYGITLGPDEEVYAADWRRVLRIDPDTGESSRFLQTANGWDARITTFDATYSRMYIGTVDNRGRIFFVDLDENMEPLDYPRVFVEGVGSGWHDGLGMDACGNLYAIDYESAGLYRITPEGDVSLYLDWSDDRSTYGHDLTWGSGIGGWRSDAIYVPLSEGGLKVMEIVIGIEEMPRMRR